MTLSRVFMEHGVEYIRVKTFTDENQADDFCFEFSEKVPSMRFKPICEKIHRTMWNESRFLNRFFKLIGIDKVLYRVYMPKETWYKYKKEVPG